MGGLGDTRDYSAETLFQSFLQKTIVSSLAMGRDVHSLVLSIQGALKDGFGEAVAACDMHEPYTFSSLDSC